MKTKTAYIYGIKAILLAYFLTSPALPAKEKTVTIPSKYQTIFDSYCTDCHNARRKKGKVRLDKGGFSFAIKTIEDANKWHTILEVMNSKEMPPEDEKQLPENVKADFLETLSKKLVEARSMLSDSGGKTVIRRMNRREYNSSMKALSGVNIDASELPDDKSTGFDTDGASLFMSAGQIEIYQDLAKKALTNALTVPTDKPLKVRRESEDRINPLIQKIWRDTILKNYTNARRYFYAKSKDKNAKASDFDLVDEQDARTRLGLHWSEKVADYVHYTSHPLTRAGMLLSYDSSTKNNEEYILIGNAPKTTGKKTPKRKPRANKKPTNQQNPNPPAGLYKLRLRVGTTPEAIPEDSFMEMHINGKRIDTFHIKATAGKPQILEIDHEIKSDTDRKIIFKARINPKMRAKRIKDAKMMTGRAPDPSIWIDWVEWEGPLKRGNKNIDRLQMFLDGFNGNDTLLKNEIRNFTQLAYKGQKPSDEVINKLADIFKQNIKNGKTKSEAMVNTLANVLASPNFLYMPEKHSGSQAKFLDKRELAVKLAAFLWSSPPDKKLFEISSSQELTSQVKRMLQDPKLDNFIESFLYQWLHMERFSFFQFDAKKYPFFDGNLKESAKQEVFETFKTILRQKLDSKNLLKSDFVVVDALMADYYGLKGITGDKFQKVKLPKNSPRGGFLGMAAILAMGSNGVHTSPVERGVWILRMLLNDPPPPAPANVPQLSRLAGKKLSVSELVKAHQEEAQCAHCHRKIDPLGLGLENFDAVGRWRTKDDRNRKHIVSVNAFGKFHNGPKFKNYFEMRDIIAAKVDDFNLGLTKAMLSYALGRQVGFTDQPLVEALHKHMKKHGNSLEALILGIVQSKAFRTKK